MRYQRGLSLKVLAEQIGITGKHLSSIEHGEGASLDVMVDLVEELDVSLDYVVRGIWPEEMRWGLVFHDEDELEALLPVRDVGLENEE